MPRPRGAFKSPRHVLAGATPHVITGVAPPQFIRIPSTLSMWLNDVDGDCVVAEEAFAKACHNPEIFIQDATVKSWAKARGVLNGAYLLDVLGMMHKHGFDQSGHVYDNGGPTSVDWSNTDILQNAIWTGPVKLGVAADQLENAVGNTNGWFATGFTADSNEDHCVSLSGYGSFGWLAGELGVTVPKGLNASTPGYGLFTWSTIGIIDVPSMMAITGEAWLRTPTTRII